MVRAMDAKDILYWLRFEAAWAQTYKKCCKGLPMMFNLPSNSRKLVMTSYDSGTQANHMSLGLADEMGLELLSGKQDKSAFRLANGTIVKSIGRVSVPVAFANPSSADDLESIHCYFNV